MPLEKDYLLINRYRILDILGQGGMGAVYRSIDENLGVEVAVKENLFTSDEYIRQFRREATILAGLKHANLPRVFDHFELEGQGQYLVMDYIEGEDIRQRMDRTGVLPEEEVVLVAVSICDALQYLHTRTPPIFHRDIKPGNIKINPEGVVFLVDFGLAKVASGGEATTTGARAMTPGYSSPEQYGTARTDARSDVYSLGATMYAILTAAIPEDGLARAMDQADLSDIRKYNPKVTRRLINIIIKALSIHPEDRYQSAEEFRMNLLTTRTVSKKLVIGGGSELTVPPPPTDVIEAIAEGKVETSQLLSQTQVDMSAESLKRIRKRRRQGIFRGVGVTGIVGFAAFAIWFGSGGYVDVEKYIASLEKPTSTALAGLGDQGTPIGDDQTGNDEATATPTATLEPTATPILIKGVTLTPTLTPIVGLIENEVLAYASDQSGTVQIWLYESDFNTFRRITDTEEGACQPAWHPDGNRFAFISPCEDNRDVYLNSQIYLWDMDTSEVTPLVTELGAFDPDWSPDGTNLLYVQANTFTETQIKMWNVVENTTVDITPRQRLNLSPTWSPDGTKILYTTSNTVTGQIRLVIQDSDDLQADPTPLTRSQTRQNFSADWWPDGERVVFSQRDAAEEGSIRHMFWVSLEVLELDFSEYEEFRVSVDFSVVPERDPAISFNGYWIAFESWPEGGNHDIYIIHWDGSTRFKITNNEGLDFDPAWRPLSE